LRRVDLAVLAVCDLPLFLPFLAALAVLPPASGAQRALHAAAVIGAAAQLPLVQWLAARRPRLAVLAAGLQLVGLWLLAAGWSPAPFIAACVAAAIFTLRRAERPVALPGARAGELRHRVWPLPAAAPVWARLAYFDLRGLIDPRRLLRHLSLAACVLLPWLLRDYLEAYGLRPSVVTTVVVLTMVPLVFSVSGLAFELRRMHGPLRPMYASLGIRTGYLRAVDVSVLLAVLLPSMLPLLAAAWLSSGSARVLAVLPLAALALVACAALNFRGDRGVMMFKVLACAVAAGIALDVIQP
jgi:hypothetical protein